MKSARESLHGIAAIWLLMHWAGAAHAQRELDDIEGSWRGSVSVVATAGNDDRFDLHIGDEIQLKIEITSNDARISVLGVDALELHDVRLDRLGASATVFSFMGTDDEADNWAITVTNQDNRSMLIVLSRVVSPPSTQSGIADAWVMGAIGELHKTEDE